MVKLRVRFLPFALALLSSCMSNPAAAVIMAHRPLVDPQTFTVSGHQFLMDGRPYQIISGEIHYRRIPRPYWRDRLRKRRATGLNTITTTYSGTCRSPSPGTSISAAKTTPPSSFAKHKPKVLTSFSVQGRTEATP